MSNALQLPPPSLTVVRQTAVGVLGSPITLSRNTSIGSDRSEIRNPDEVMRERLALYKTHLEHELQFVDNEIQALFQRTPSQDPVEEAALRELRNSLKVRYNRIRVKLTKVSELLEII